MKVEKWYLLLFLWIAGRGKRSRTSTTLDGPYVTIGKHSSLEKVLRPPVNMNVPGNVMLGGAET